MEFKSFQSALTNLAASLGGQWAAQVANPDYERSIARGELWCPTGETLFLTGRWGDRRMICVSCRWPVFHGRSFDPKTCGLETPDSRELTMSFRADRAAACVCAELKRRVLDDYMQLFPLCVSCRDRQSKRFNTLVEEVHELKDAGQLRLNKGSPRLGEDLSLSLYQKDGVTGTYRVSSWSSQVRIELNSVPLALAKRIAEIVTNFR